MRTFHELSFFFPCCLISLSCLRPFFTAPNLANLLHAFLLSYLYACLQWASSLSSLLVYCIFFVCAHASLLQEFHQFSCLPSCSDNPEICLLYFPSFLLFCLLSSRRQTHNLFACFLTFLVAKIVATSLYAFLITCFLSCFLLPFSPATLVPNDLAISLLLSMVS